MNKKPITWRGDWTTTHFLANTKIITKQTKKRNLITTYGLGQLSSAIGGGYLPPSYIAIEGANPLLAASRAIGNTTFTSTWTLPTTTGVICVGLGTANQENVTCTSFAVVSGTPTYTISPGFTKVHSAGETFTLIPLATDDPSVIQSPIQYDALNNPNQWMQSVNGYQSGVGQYTLSFFFNALQAVGYLTKVGLTDGITIGSGNLHSWLLYGVDHSASIEDLMINCVLTSSST